jgi:hypothetical protein
MDPKFLVNMLCEMHIAGTTSIPPTFTFCTDITIDKLNKDKFTEVIKNQKSFNQFVKLCMDKFTEKYPTQPYGSVHCNPAIWTDMALATVRSFIKENNPVAQLTFPNGCCTLNECSINKFYLIVVDEIIL